MMLFLKKYFKITVASYFLLLPQIVDAFEETSITIMDAFFNAFERDARIKAAQSALRSAQQGVTLSGSHRWPKINSTGSLGLSDVGSVNELGNPQSDGFRATYGIEVDQNLYSFGRNDARYKKAITEVSISQNKLLKTEQEVLLDVANAYIDLLQEQKLVAALSEHSKTLADLAHATEEKYKEELVTEIDFYLVKARLAQAEADLSVAKANLSNARNSFERLTGIAVDTLYDTSVIDLLTRIPSTLDRLLAFSLGNAPSLKIAEAQYKLADANLLLERSERWPDFSLVGRMSRGRIGQRDVNTEEVGIRFRVELFDGGASHSKITSRRHDLEEAREQMAFAEEMAEQTTRSYHNQLEGLEISITAWHEAIDAENKALEGLFIQVEEGVKPISDYLESKERAIDNIKQEISLSSTILRTKFKLLEAIGALNRLQLLSL